MAKLISLLFASTITGNDVQISHDHFVLDENSLCDIQNQFDVNRNDTHVIENIENR